MKATYQIRVFVCLDDLSQEGMKGWNSVEHKIEIRGDVDVDSANDLIDKITNLVKLEAKKASAE